MTHARPQLELNPRQTQSLGRPAVARKSVEEHRVVSTLPPWPPAPLPPEFRGRGLVIELGGLALATVCFAAAICALARIFYLAEEHNLGLAMFAMLAALCGSFTWLGCRLVLAIGAWLERARALSAASSLRSDSDPSPRPPTRDSRC
jgi:hypothetical protein